VLTELDGRRTAALAGRGGFAAVDITGSPAERADLLLRAGLVSQHLDPVGLAPHLLAVTPKRSSASEALLLVTDELPAYRLEGPGGTPAFTVAARGPRTFTVELVAVPVGWRVRDVVSGAG
jgi:hypothetical protein